MSASTLWVVAGAVFMLTELFSPLCVMLFFGFGCWAAALASYLGADLTVCLAVFSVASVGSLLGLRKTLLNVFAGRSRHTEPDEASEAARPFPYRDRRGQVTQRITGDNQGEISLGGSFWRAVATHADQQTLEVGTWVRVIGHAPDDELVLRVVAYTAPEESCSENASENKE